MRKKYVKGCVLQLENNSVRKGIEKHLSFFHICESIIIIIIVIG